MQHLSEIVEEARKKGKKRLAVAYGQDAHTLAAVYAAYKEGLVEPILFGDPKIIEQVCKEENIDCNIFKIIPESNDVKCVNLAVNAVVTGEADVLMKGLVSTDKYMRGILNKDAGLFPPKGTLSHVAVVEMPNYPKLLVISDVAVIPQPDFKQKTILIGYLTRIANLIGILGFKPPTKDLNVTAALALMSIVLIEVAGIRARGTKGWLKSFAEPMPIILPINILEVFIKPLSLCMRLFGNVLGSFVIMELLKMVVPAVLPAVFSCYFDIFDGLIQAYFFVFLTGLFIKEATE